MSKKIIFSLLFSLIITSLEAKKADWTDLPSVIKYRLQITGPAPEFYEKHARRLLARFNLKDPFSVFLVETDLNCGGFACWCDVSFGDLSIGEKYKILALETAWIQNLAHGSKMMLLAHEIAHMVDFQRFGVEKFFGPDIRTPFCHRIVEEHADKMALVMVCCSECIKEQGDLWKLLAEQYDIPEETVDTESGSHPNLIRRAKYHYTMAQAYEGVLFDHHLMAQCDDNYLDYTGMMKGNLLGSSNNHLTKLELDRLYQRFTGQSCCQKVSSQLHKMVGK